MKKTRFDNRTKKEFANAIKECTDIEQTLIKVYVDWLNSNLDPNQPQFTFSNNGIDNTGKFISHCKDVDCRPDFILHREGKPDRKIDIKFARKHSDQFHVKIQHIQEYLRTDTCIVNFMGIDQEDPKFCILTPQDIQFWFIYGKLVEYKPWGYKPCIRFKSEDIEWHYYKT